MSSSLILIISSISLLFLLTNVENILSKPSGLYIPIKKDPKTHLYYTNIVIGTPALAKGFVIDLGGRAPWINCETYVSSSYRPILCNSTECKSLNVTFCSRCDYPPRKNCYQTITCAVDTWNPVKGIYVDAKELGYDTIKVYSTEYSHLYDVPHSVFSCSDSLISEELGGNNSGMIGLGRTKISLNAQLANNFGLPNRFALCIPSSKKGNGDLFIGGGPYFMPPHKEDLSKSLIRIPLIINHRHNGFPLIRDPKPEYEYFVNVKSIKVDGKYVPFNTSLLSIDRMGDGGTKISTVDPFTILHTSIYEAVVNAFVKSATDKNITKISSEKPYGACFNSTTITNFKIGPNVPTVDLVFESKDKVYWRVYGTNSMVRLNSDVMCLGLIDGGSNTSPSIVVGGNFLEDNLLEFDLVSSTLGFTNSLSLYNTSCSHVRV